MSKVGSNTCATRTGQSRIKHECHPRKTKSSQTWGCNIHNIELSKIVGSKKGARCARESCRELLGGRGVEEGCKRKNGRTLTA
jgi:hypothetical protein